MVNLNNILKRNVSELVSPIVVPPLVIKAVDVREHFENIEEFELRDDMLQWIRLEATRLRFGIVIARSDNGTDRRNAFIILTCERSGKYVAHIQNFKAR